MNAKVALHRTASTLTLAVARGFPLDSHESSRSVSDERAPRIRSATGEPYRAHWRTRANRSSATKSANIPASRIDSTISRGAGAPRARRRVARYPQGVARNVGFLTKRRRRFPVPEPSWLPERFVHALESTAPSRGGQEATMHGIIYLIGLIVVIMAILSLFGLR